MIVLCVMNGNKTEIIWMTYMTHCLYNNVGSYIKLFA